jgi:hypothetical protein
VGTTYDRRHDVYYRAAHVFAGWTHVTRCSCWQQDLFLLKWSIRGNILQFCWKSILVWVTMMKVPLYWVASNEHLFLTILQGGKSQVKVLTGSVSGEGFLLIAGSFSLNPHETGGQGISMGPLIGALIPVMGALSLWSNYFPEVPPPNIITLGVRISAYGLDHSKDCVIMLMWFKEKQLWSTNY